LILVDASVWVASRAPVDRYHSAALALIRDHRASLAALDLTLYEVANTVGLKLGQPRDAQTLARAIVAICRDGRLIRIDADLLDAAIATTREHGLSAYDATYVAAAQRNGWQLVSTDIRDLVSQGFAVTPDAAVYP
jgi:predicted nucleic acid-binding protein